MDVYDIFRKLTRGIKFDTNKFHDDATRFQLIKPIKPKKPEETTLSDPKLKEELAKREDKITDTRKRTHEDECNDQEKPPKKKRQEKSEGLKAKLKQHEINHLRNTKRIYVSGTDIPNPIETFEDLSKYYKVNSSLLKNIKALGYDTPTPIQMQAIPLLIQRRELLGCAPTGSGKTAAFLIPILHHLKEPQKCGFRAIIVSPTRELAKQTHQECTRLADGLGFRVCIIDKPGKAAEKYGPKSSQKFDILVTTPNRLVYLINHDPPIINMKNVEWLVVDESDKLFETGDNGFRDQLAVIYNACDSKNIRHAMFSATFAFDVEEWCKVNLDNVVNICIGIRNTAAELVDQELIFVGNEGGKLVAFRDIIKKGIKPPVLVFVQSKERAQELYRELIYDGINVDIIHSDRTQLQRKNVVKCFRSGAVWVLICTELMGRGMDFKGVNLVINYDFPPGVISYIHRIGRTGRAGRPGKAVTFFTSDDVDHLRSIAQVLRDSGCEVPEYMLQLKKPNRKEKRKAIKSTVTRQSISTIPLYDVENKKKKKKMILKSKKKVQKN